jgi:hypothetical protein
LVLLIFVEREKFRSPIAADGVKGAPFLVGPVSGKAERRQKLAVKLAGALEIFYAQINVIEISRFHLGGIALTLILSALRPVAFGSTRSAR